ncbi:MAG: hypothetical protein J6C45_04820 [Alistipes sp.]|nr:hypothetical protein [Alistipes sp.]
MKNIILVLCCILFPLMVMGENVASKKRPKWVDGYYQDNKNSYIDVVSATGYTIEEAREKAVAQIAKNRSLATGQQVTVDNKDGEIVFSADNLTVKCRVLDEYYERLGAGTYKVSLLVQTAKHPDLPFEPVKVGNRYPFSPRAFVPGMAQMYKGSTAKGVLFIAGEIAAVGGIIAFEGMRSSYDSKMRQTLDANAIKNYAAKAKDMENLRNGFIVGAAAIYLWNVVDGAVAKGKYHIEVGKAGVNFTPYASTQSSGLMLCMKF